MQKKEERVKVNIQTGEGLIIERKDLVTELYVAGSITWSAVAWISWMLLLRPLILGLLWYLGFRTASFQMLYLEGIKNVEFFTNYTYAILGIFFILFAWNRYNVYMFRGKDRRKPRGECTPESLAKYYNLKTDDIHALQSSNVDIYFDNGAEAIILKTNKNQEFHALYAPQDLNKHFSNMHGKQDIKS